MTKAEVCIRKNVLKADKDKNAFYLLETQFYREKIVEKITGYIVEE